jgi:hypothetical protein
MMTFAGTGCITGLMVGLLLGALFKVYILVPVIILAILAVTAAGIVLESEGSTIVVVGVVSIIAIQFGYLGGAAIRASYD